MKILSITYLLVFCTIFGYSQSTFVTKLDPSLFNDSRVYDVYYDEETDDIYTVGLKGDSSDAVWLTRLDANGQLMTEVEVEIPSEAGLLAHDERMEIKKLSDGRYLTVGTVDLFPSSPYYLYFDQELEEITIASEIYEDAIAKTHYGIEVIDDEQIIAGGLWQSSERDIFIQREDGNRNLVWEVTIGFDNDKNERYSAMHVQADKVYLSYSTVPRSGTTSKRETKIAVFSLADGSLLHDIILDIASESTATSEVALVPNTNGEQLAISVSRYLSGDNLRIMYYIINLNGQVLHESSYGDELTNGNALPFNKWTDRGYVVAGHYASIEKQTRLPVVGMYDSTADSLWTSTYDINDSDIYVENYILSGQQILGDGSMIISGNVFLLLAPTLPPLGSTPFVFKLDANGCLEPGCRQIVNSVDIDKQAVTIYPNPIRTYATIYSPTDATLRIYSTTGSPLLSQTLSQGYSQHDLHELSSGLYIYEVLDSTGTKIDTGQLVKQ